MAILPMDPERPQKTDLKSAVLWEDLFHENLLSWGTLGNGNF